MNILLNGATAGSNFGDFLFAKAFQDYVGGIVGKENVYWYNSRYAMSDFYATGLHLKTLMLSFIFPEDIFVVMTKH